MVGHCTISPSLSCQSTSYGVTTDELEEEEYAKENVEQASCALQDVVHATVDLGHSDQGVGGFID